MEQTKDSYQHYIIGIGASAGGLEAINFFFDALKDYAHLSFIIVQHLSPDYKSLLVELVGRHTKMQVLEAGDGTEVEPAHIYVIPNNRMITIQNGTLRLSKIGARNIPNNAIDIFFQSLAEDQKERAIAILLSGTGSDGTRGIAYIKAENGYVLVQDPKTAKFDGMPNMAILSGHVNQILPPTEMPNNIAQYIEKERSRQADNRDNSIGKEDLKQIFKMVFEQSGNDFSHYKPPTMIRRIRKRMDLYQLQDPLAYIQLLKKDKEEASNLAKDLVINVTRFFRDEDAFQYLYERVFPHLLAKQQEEKTIKIWICACSTGEEAYTVAILIDKYLQEQHLTYQVKIFATDIDNRNIESAGRNSFPKQVKSQVPPNLFQHYFVDEGSGYSIIPRIRKQIVFAKHNVLSDPAFIKNDLICCRNMLIYMDRSMQENILENFHFALKDGGYLFLGKSETTSAFEKGFEPTSGKWKIYKRSKNILQKKHWQASIKDKEHIKNASLESPFSEKAKNGYLGEHLEKILFEKIGHVALYVDQSSYEIKETLGDFSAYLSLPKGKLQLNILSMAPEELRFHLANGIQEIKKKKKGLLLKNLSFNKQGKMHHVHVHMAPLNEQIGNPLILVLLMKAYEEELAVRPVLREVDVVQPQDKYVQNLELELQDTKISLQMALENMETVNEELQSSNEELLSSNEELQSSNEELQSLNEELHTLNNEHQSKILELVELNDDLNNYFKSTDIGQIFLDKNLCIRKFTPQAKKFVNLIENDIGRPIGHFSNNLLYDELLQDIQTVLDKNKVVEREVELANGGTNLLRIFPFIRKDKILDGIVLTFVDISDVSHLHNVIKGVFNSSINPIFVLEYVHDKENNVVDFQIVTCNEAAKQILIAPTKNKKPSKLSFIDYFGQRIDEKQMLRLMDGIKSNKTFHGELHLNLDDKIKFYEASAQGMKAGLVMTFNDISSQKEALQKLRKNYNELISVRENLRKLNLKLEEEVENRTVELSKSEERFRYVARATNDCIRDWDLVNNKIWHSENYYNIFDYPRESRQLQAIKDWFDKIHRSDLKRVKEGIFKAINDGEEQWNAEYRFLKGNGGYEYVLERSFIMNDGNGIPYRIISSVMDISALKAAELANKELARKKDEFMSIASHELKTPVTSMKVSLQLIDRFVKNGDNLPKIKTFVEKSNHQVEKLSFLIETLLDVSKVQSGKIQLDIQTFNLGDILKDSIYEVQTSSKHKINVHDNTDITINADKNRIEQVLINFLTNAIKYSPDANTVDVFIEQDGRNVKVNVKDYGIGIPKEKHNMVFDRFFRVEDAAKQFSGLGLGLFISADIIKRHKGKIGVESKEKEGSTFWFTIPILSKKT